MMPLKYYVGVDLGGTKIAAVLRDGESIDSLKSMTAPTEAHEGPDKVIDRMAGVVQRLCGAARIGGDQLAGVGVGVRAVIDYEEGLTLLMPNLAGNWKGLSVSKLLRDRLNCPVWLINDARAFALAEANYGAGRGVATITFFTVGTGI